MKSALLATAALALTLAACSNGAPAVSDETNAGTTAATSAGAETGTEAAAAAAAPAAMTAEQSIVAEARACAGAAETTMLVVDPPVDGNQNPEANAAASRAYLDAVRAEPCVFELPSGLLFRIRQAAEDGISPVSGDLVTVHYRGMFAYGGEFDSSYARGEPATFPSDRLIAGWVEALPLMRVGEAWDLFIAPELAYGLRGTPGGPIGPNEALAFQLELMDVPGAQ
ncbi:FKBP-type peptidyl-prolyl cis-trans isomerase [Maricaulis sp.]|uniref:FKBP-type peptidyl-prolyl cis-trans isomerase n=1 Tax=Maricaulis sp. TaxID=1486257 RepID=UPI003A92F290